MLPSETNKCYWFCELNFINSKNMYVRIDQPSLLILSHVACSDSVIQTFYTPISMINVHLWAYFHRTFRWYEAAKRAPSTVILIFYYYFLFSCGGETIFKKYCKLPHPNKVHQIYEHCLSYLIRSLTLWSVAKTELSLKLLVPSKKKI